MAAYKKPRHPKGFIHLTPIFVLAVLLLVTTWVAGLRTQTSGLASELPQDYYGILRENNFFDCESHFHLVNLEGDEVAHCLVVGTEDETSLQKALGKLVNQNVKIYGSTSEIAGKRYLIVQSVEKVGGISLLKNKVLDVLGAFIKRVIAR